MKTSEVSCRQIAELLVDYVDGTLPMAQHECVDRHIERCAVCPAFVNTYKATISAVNRLRIMSIPAEATREPRS